MFKYFVASRLYVFFLLAPLFFSCSTKTPEKGKSLETRIKEFHQLYKREAFVDLVEYMHPSIFKIASKKQVITELKDTFADDSTASFDIDSINTISISDELTVKNTSYRKIDHNLVMIIVYKDKSILDDADFITERLTAFREGFPEGKVSFDSIRKAFLIKTKDGTIAIKEENSEWQFLGYDIEKEFLRKLFPLQVIEKFDLTE